jgi:3-dehydroquinate dehydratase/shikimate dehydrogenase
MTLLIASVIAHDPSTLIARAEAAWAKGAEAVELRIDTLAVGIENIRDYIVKHSARTFIVTCRSKPQGGEFEGPLHEAAERLARFADLRNAILDVEVADLEGVQSRITGAEAESQVPDLKSHILNLKSQIVTGGSAGGRTIGSAHFLDRKPANLRTTLKSTLVHSAIAKVAYLGEHIADSLEAVDLMHEFRDRAIAIAMGEDGSWSRLLAKKLGAFGTFASLEQDAATAPGQLTLDEMLDQYRWREIDANTRVFGVVGDPVAHSLSPMLFNHWFTEAGINAVYLPLRVRGTDALTRFLAGCTDRPWLDIGGFSVTIPHKEAALTWLGTPSDNLTRSIGALNTLCVRDGRAFGYNTDCYAGVASVAAALGLHATNLSGLRINVLGAGGAARAILEGFGGAGCKMTVFARSFAKAAKLGEQFHCDAVRWEERGRKRADILINTTPAGMWPSVNESPLDLVEAAARSSSDNRQSAITESLSHYRLVFDLIYRPLETRLLRDARAAGCQTLNGLDMFLRQAAVQFELWTGMRPSLDSAEAHLRANDRPPRLESAS